MGIPITADPVRVRADVRGTVQGVGFRPFVYRLAAELGLAGWVRNSPGGAAVEAEGPAPAVAEFLRLVCQDRPPRCHIASITHTPAAALGATQFEILPSDRDGPAAVSVPPDLTTCPACLRELFDPADRRFRYPFLNCTDCGPRFTILEAMPYDRSRTTMRHFPLCDRCRAEYEDPADRRFHAEPVACPACGPRLALWDPAGRDLAAGDDALRQTAEAIRAGRVVAVKGLGGFHLLCDARNEGAVAALRRRKAREEKPFAVMAPSLAWVNEQCGLSAEEVRLLTSPEAPIVLLRRRGTAGVAAGVAPGNPYLGVMLPYTPLHHLLLADLGFPVVATSGNRTDEPICTDPREALDRLGGIADVLLVHDRPIARPVDDSVVRVVLGREQVIRRARGYAPVPVPVGEPLPPVLAVGAYLKNAIAVATPGGVCLSQHLGDLETAAAAEAFARAVEDLPRFVGVRPVAAACDLHPDYQSTRYAGRCTMPAIRVQHHYAHVLACLADNGLRGPALGVAWDGTGLGTDGTAWGGEFLRVTDDGFERVAHLRPFRLPGGDRVAREPRRAALGVLYELFGPLALAHTHLPPIRAFEPAERRVLGAALANGVNAPVTSSAGRLFDAVAALVGLRQEATFEGQAAAELEWAAEAARSDEAYPFGQDGAAVDWGPAVLEVIEDVSKGVPAGEVAGRFHNTLVEMIVAVARGVGEPVVALTGGCFQNAYLLAGAVGRLTAAGFEPVCHQRVPPNDGGVALGQALAAGRQLRTESSPCA
ncbi:MAG: carbamoyltransferase HypF [Gemmataceae bacterium]|nr:carbamoyltransferase HypF [Gemmataceae bacterium]